MDKPEYERRKQEILDTYGVPVRGNGWETKDNESATQLKKLAAEYSRAVKAKAYQATKELSQTLTPNDFAKAKVRHINSISILESDLKEFRGKDKDIVAAWFENMNLSHKEIAARFDVNYQYVAGLLNSDKRTLILRAKYFREALSDNTMIALLKLTQDADPKIVLAAAEYLKLLSEKKESNTNGAKEIDDPVAEKALTLLGDWLASERKEALVIEHEHLA